MGREGELHPKGASLWPPATAPRLFSSVSSVSPAPPYGGTMNDLQVLGTAKGWISLPIPLILLLNPAMWLCSDPHCPKPKGFMKPGKAQGREGIFVRYLQHPPELAREGPWPKAKVVDFVRGASVVSHCRAVTPSFLCASQLSITITNT